MNMDEKIIEYGITYLQQRLPLVQLETHGTLRNIVSDLMWIGKYGREIDFIHPKKSP